MRWVRGRRTGVIALANSTYAPVTELTARILDLVKQQGFILDATPPNGEFVSSAAAQLVALVNEWDDSKADELFADNVQLDECVRETTQRRRSSSARSRWIDVEVETEASGTAHCTDANGHSESRSVSRWRRSNPRRSRSTSCNALPVSDS